jgi:MFS family permease
MWMDLTPLRRHRNFRLLYSGQFVSTMGTMTAYVALPYQLYKLTHSPLMVGLLGGVQLIPVLLFSLLGGALADALDRKKLLALSEGVMALSALGLILNALWPTPSIAAIFVLAFLTQAASALHRPTLEALKQSLVEPEEYPAMGALSAFQGSFCAIIGPALGGIMMAQWGAASVYGLDLLTYLVGLACILGLKLAKHTGPRESVSLESIREGLAFARARPALMGTYIVDIVAMLFAFPTALYPAMAIPWGGAPAAGVLYSAMAVGSLGISLFSGRFNRIQRRGAGVIIGASLWGFAIIGLGFVPSLWWAFALLVMAGAADMISGLFRGVIWNECIPNTMRGRLAGIEMVSYLSGPLLGNLRAGWMAEQWGLSLAIWSGGLICAFAVLSCIWLLPAFWHYRPEQTPS